MTDTCCQNDAGSPNCEMKSKGVVRPKNQNIMCPECDQKGKPIQGQTVKAMLSLTLHEVKAEHYRFCRTESCPVVYYSVTDNQVFTTADVRERVYQKEPKEDDVLVCYCFNHTVFEIRKSSPEEGERILADINSGIMAGRCACDLRNPQGSCCLGNVQALLKSKIT